MSEYLFEVYNQKGIRVMYTYDAKCRPDAKQLSSMSKAGYTFKLNGKRLTKKEISI